MMKLREKLQSFALLLIISLLSTVTAWAGDGTTAPTGAAHTPGTTSTVKFGGRDYEVFFSNNAAKNSLLVGSNTSETTQATSTTGWCNIGSSCGSSDNNISTAFTLHEFISNVKTSNNKAITVQSTDATEHCVVMVVAGYDSIAVFGKSSDLNVYAEVYNADTETYGSPSSLTLVKSTNKSSHYKRAFALDKTKQYRLSIAYGTSGTSNKYLVGFSLCVPSGSSNPKVTSAVSPTGAGIVTMKLTYDEGDVIDSGDEVESNSTVWLQAAANPGYTFSSWSGGASGNTNPTTVASITSDKTFTANFTADTYSITLDKGTGGSENGSATATYNSATLTSKTDATHATKTLAGYYTAASAGTKVANVDGTLLANVDGYTGAGGKWTRTSATTLYAQWTDAPITYDLTTNTASTTFNECKSVSPTTGNVIASSTISTYGTAGADASNTAKENETQKLKIDEEYTAANYYEWTFAVGSGKMFTPSGVNMKFQAVSDLVQYKVVLTDGTTSYETTFTNTTSKGSTLETLAWNITPTKGLTGTVRLKLWAYKAVAGNNATDFRLGSPITITGSVETAATLHTVSFEDGTSGDHGTYASTPVTQTSAGGTVTLPTVAPATGYTFTGWNTAADGTGTSYASGATYTPGSDVTLYAIYTPNTYTVTLDGNGGTGGSASVTATYNAALPSFTAPIRSGYVLTGYYTETSGGTKVIDADGTLEAGVAGYTNSESEWIGTDDDVTLYAQWAAVYTVTFDATTNEGTCSTASLTQAEPGAKIILPAATKEDYTFNGWYTAASGGSLIDGAAAEYKPTANITLYAQFSVAVATTKFHFESKTGSSNIKASTELAITTGSSDTDYAYALSGGSVYYYNAGSSRDHSYGLKLGGNAEYIKIVLGEALAIGDVISFAPEGSYKSSNQICFTTENTRNTTNTTVEFSYTVTSTDGLAGENTIYIWRTSGSTTYVNELTITSSGAAATYAISYDMGGIADDIEQLTEQTALPNPLPTPTGVTDGYTFEGWYTNSTFTTRATAGAAIAANTTLYANYIIDTPVITPAAGAYPAKTTMTLTSSVPFTQAYGGWTTGSAAYSHSELLSHSMYDDEAIDVFNGFTTPAVNSNSQHFTYMVSDGTFFSEPAVTEAYTVSNVITISVHPQNATYVVGGSATALTVVAADTDPEATKSYQWEVSDDNSSWGNIGTNSASYTPDITTAGTKYYRVTVSSDKSVDPVVSNVATITVNAAAIYTVSFDAGVGSTQVFEDKTQATASSTVPLPPVTTKDDNYQFVGWYLDDVKVANANATTYLPSGSVTLLAKYNCKVVLEKNNDGDGNVPTAVIKGTSTTVESGDFVFEGTTLTLTASPADKFVRWDVGMTGTDNPKDYMVNAYKRFVAYYTAKEYRTLYHTDFTESAWSAINGKNGGGTVTAGTSDTMTDPTVTLAASSGVSYGWSSGTLTVAPNNYNENNYIAIPVRGVNGELTITVAKGTSKTQFKYNVVVGASTDAPGSGTSSTSGKPSTVTVSGLTASNYVVYIGRQGGSYNQYTEITITTPSTKLAADSAQVRIMKNPDEDTPEATVNIITNSSGTVSIKGGNTENTSVAWAEYSEGVLTITPRGAGTTSVVMQVTADGSYTARELTIPITVQVPTITIKTQPTNIVCYQNDASEQKFTTAATVNTGNELTYQWYTCNEDGTGAEDISGAISSTYVLNTDDKDGVGVRYYKCEVSSDADGISTFTAVRSVTVSALSPGGTYSTNVYMVTPGNTVTYTGLSDNSIKDASTTGKDTYYTINNATSGQIVITAKATGTGVITLNDNTVINVTVKNHTVQLIWSAERRVYDASNWTKDAEMGLDDGSNNGLPVLTRLYEDGSEYTGRVTFYVDDTSMAYFTSPGTDTFVQDTPSTKPTIYYAGGQGGCKFYAYIASGDGIEPVKASYDLTMQKGYSNNLPSGRKVEVQQQYTLWKNEAEKLVTVTYGGYKYNDHKWDGKADSWGTATNYVGKDNAIDGYLYAVRNKDRDAKDEYEHALQDEDNFGSAWYAIGEGGATREYQRIKPFRLPCRASYITFTAHASGTLTAYVYQNGIIGRGTGAGNQLASAPRLGYWFDEEGWVQEPANTVVTKQVIQKGNGRDQRSYGGYDNMDDQMTGYWGSEDDPENPDAIIITKLRSKWCSVEKPNKDTPASAFSKAEEKPAGYYKNPYYWFTAGEITDNLGEIVPTPEQPIPHQGGHMIVNEGYVKYTINVTAGKTYYFFGKMTKVGYAGMNFVEDASENRQTEPVHLTGTDVWSEKFGEGGSSVLVGGKSTIYDKITLPSNYRIGKWNTICLPFAVNENQVEEVFGKGTELAIFNGLRHDTENHVYYIKYLRHVDQNILPGQPYLIYPTGRAVAERTNQENGGMAETGETIATVGDIIGSTVEGQTDTRLTFKNVLINKGITAQSYGCNKDADGITTSYEFKGTDQPLTIEKYDLYNTPKTGGLARWMSSSNSTLNSYHALIKAYPEAEIRHDAITFAFTEDDVDNSWETSIDVQDPDDPDLVPTRVEIVENGNANGLRARFGNGKTYNLMGQEVDANSVKGIVIGNGNKYIFE